MLAHLWAIFRRLRNARVTRIPIQVLWLVVLSSVCAWNVDEYPGIQITLIKIRREFHSSIKDNNASEMKVCKRTLTLFFVFLSSSSSCSWNEKSLRISFCAPSSSSLMSWLMDEWSRASRTEDKRDHRMNVIYSWKVLINRPQSEWHYFAQCWESFGTGKIAGIKRRHGRALQIIDCLRTLAVERFHAFQFDEFLISFWNARLKSGPTANRRGALGMAEQRPWFHLPTVIEIGVYYRLPDEWNESWKIGDGRISGLNNCKNFFKWFGCANRAPENMRGLSRGFEARKIA